MTMKIDGICIEHNVRVVPINDYQGKCPVCDKVFTLAHITLDELAVKAPSASVGNLAYNPVWGASTTGHIKEIRDDWVTGKRWQ